MDHAPRPLPPETFDGLRPPRAGFPYFAGADRYPFEPDALGYRAANAWWLADACLLAYGDRPFIERAFAASPLPAQGFTLGWLVDADEHRGMVVASDRALVVVFPGTRVGTHAILDESELLLINSEDLLTDSLFLPAACAAGGRVHAGFLQAFEQVRARLDTLANEKSPQQNFWLAGHSLGGAIATLAAAHLGADAFQSLYTYGCPRVGDAAFARTLPSGKYHRVVNGADWICQLPPDSLGYTHGGTLRALTGGPARDPLSDWAGGMVDSFVALANMARQGRFRMGELPFAISGLADHAPIYYATLSWNELVRS